MPSLSDDQRERFLASVTQDPDRGNVYHLRQILTGVTRRGELNKWLDHDLILDAQEARGRDLGKIKTTLHEIATDAKNPQAVRAAVMILNGPYGEPGWQTKTGLEVSGPEGGPVEIADRSSSLREVQRVLNDAAALDDGGADDPPVLAAARLALAPPGDV